MPNCMHDSHCPRPEYFPREPQSRCVKFKMYILLTASAKKPLSVAIGGKIAQCSSNGCVLDLYLRRKGREHIRMLLLNHFSIEMAKERTKTPSTLISPGVLPGYSIILRLIVYHRNGSTPKQIDTSTGIFPLDASSGSFGDPGIVKTRGMRGAFDSSWSCILSFVSRGVVGIVLDICINVGVPQSFLTCLNIVS